RALRLSGILAASPHLLRTHFQVLRKIGLSFFTRKLPSADVFHFARDLIALPSMREVDIVQLTKGQNRGSDVLATLFERCTRAWEAVIFRKVYAPSGLDNTCAPRPREQCAKIKRLPVDGSDDFEDWLISPSRPFDFTELVEVAVQHDSGNPALW
ncbi:hypothetical protein DFH09DRAFT_1427325, partial [Mycena vulgaris]